ncbi:MAG: hypothetical protein NT131_07245 [Methanomassiliicoccales archaeon]|nr:hypothetical protein [Methanomassiliicoccales archaeon]
MKFPNALKPIILAVAMSAILISTAYFAAGALHDQLVPPTEDAVVSVTLEEIDTNGLGGTIEHPHLPPEVVKGVEYDLGIKVVGLAEGNGVRVFFSITRTGISVDDVECYYYDTISSSWRSLYFVDQGDSLRATLGPTAGTDVYDGYEKMNRLIITFEFDGTCAVDCWADSD